MQPKLTLSHEIMFFCTSFMPGYKTAWRAIWTLYFLVIVGQLSNHFPKCLFLKSEVIFLIGWAVHRRHPGGWGGDLRGPQAGLVRLLTLLQTGLTTFLCSSLSGNELSQRWRLAYQKLFMEHSWRQIDEDILCLPSPPFCPLTDLSDSDILSSLNYNEITRTAALP